MSVGDEGLVEATDRWLGTLSLLPHQQPLAALLRALAHQIVTAEAPTAAAISEYRKTIDVLTPRESKQAGARTNRDEILGAGEGDAS